MHKITWRNLRTIPKWTKLNSNFRLFVYVLLFFVIAFLLISVDFESSEACVASQRFPKKEIQDYSKLSRNPFLVQIFKEISVTDFLIGFFRGSGKFCNLNINMIYVLMVALGRKNIAWIEP